MAKKTTTPTPPPFNPTPMATPMNPTQFWDEFMEAWYNWLDSPHSTLTLANQDALDLLDFYKGLFSTNAIDYVNGTKKFSKLKETELTPFDLPEPYMGNYGLDPTKYKFVIINLNPGGCATEVDSENIYYTEVKSHNNSKMKLGANNGSLVIKYADTMSYSTYLKDYSCLAGESAIDKSTKPEGFINGYDWWNGDPNSETSEGRMRWIKDFYCRLCGNTISNEDVLALELCPFHSKKWGGSKLLKFIKEKDQKGKETNQLTFFGICLKNYLFDPAFQTAINAAKNTNHKPFIVCVGGNVKDAISKIYESKNLFHCGIGGTTYYIDEIQKDDEQIRILTIKTQGTNELPAVEKQKLELLVLYYLYK